MRLLGIDSMGKLAKSKYCGSVCSGIVGVDSTPEYLPGSSLLQIMAAVTRRVREAQQNYNSVVIVSMANDIENTPVSVWRAAGIRSQYEYEIQQFAAFMRDNNMLDVFVVFGGDPSLWLGYSESQQQEYLQVQSDVFSQRSGEISRLYRQENENIFRSPLVSTATITATITITITITISVSILAQVAKHKSSSWFARRHPPGCWTRDLVERSRFVCCRSSCHFACGFSAVFYKHSICSTVHSCVCGHITTATASSSSLPSVPARCTPAPKRAPPVLPPRPVLLANWWAHVTQRALHENFATEWRIATVLAHHLN